MIKGILFDMDGVLMDSEPVHYAAYERILGRFGLHLPYEEYATFIGSTQVAILQYLRAHYEIPISDEALTLELAQNKAELNRRDGYPAMDGLLPMLVRVRRAGLRLAVASSSPADYIEDAMQQLGAAPYFEKMISGESVPRSKPEPDIFLYAAAQLGLLAEECVVVEDSENGIRAARAAGMRCIALANPHSPGQRLELADAVIGGLPELREDIIQGETFYLGTENDRDSFLGDQTDRRPGR